MWKIALSVCGFTRGLGLPGGSPRSTERMSLMFSAGRDARHRVVDTQEQRLDQAVLLIILRQVANGSGVMSVALLIIVTLAHIEIGAGIHLNH